MKLTHNKGISMIEILIVIAIMVVIIAIVVLSLSRFRAEQSLQGTTADIVSLLNEARTNTISSKNSTTYGVYFETNRAVLFAGSSFSEPNSNNKQLDLDSTVNIPSSGGISLNGGSSSVVFTRISGDTANYGTIILRLTSDATRQKTITINKTGVVSSN